MDTIFHRCNRLSVCCNFLLFIFIAIEFSNYLGIFLKVFYLMSSFVKDSFAHLQKQESFTILQTSTEKVQSRGSP